MYGYMVELFNRKITYMKYYLLYPNIAAAYTRDICYIIENDRRLLYVYIFSGAIFVSTKRVHTTVVVTILYPHSHSIPNIKNAYHKKL